MARLNEDQLKQLVMDSASACGLDPLVALVQIDRESAHFAPAVVYGPKTGADGEKGMAQFMPDTWKRFGSGQHNNAYDPVESMNAYCGYMLFLLNRFGWNYEKALQGYNGGEGNVDRNTVSARAKNYAREVIAQADALRGSGLDSVSPGDRADSGQIPTGLIVAGAGLAALVAWAVFSD